MEYYKTLTVNQRIQFKDCFILLCGVDFQKVGRILSLRQRIDIMYEKLKLEGFDV